MGCASLFGIALLSIAVGFLQAGSSVIMPNVVLLGLAVVFLYLPSRKLRSARKVRRATKEEIASLEDPSDESVALAAISFRRGRRRTGYYRGMIWHEEGVIHFSGSACYFALPRSAIKFTFWTGHLLEIRLEDSDQWMMVESLVWPTNHGAYRLLAVMSAQRNFRGAVDESELKLPPDQHWISAVTTRLRSGSLPEKE